MTLPMPTSLPVVRTGVVMPGAIAFMDNISMESFPDREFPACYFKVGHHYGAIVVYSEDPSLCGANADLIAAAFNAAEAARQLGFDPIAAILALPKLLAACELAVNGTAGERDCSNDDECGIWPAICDALSAARTREVRP